MSEFIEIGGFDDDEQHRAENLVLPPLPKLTVLPRMRDALDAAVVTRSGIIVIGPKGAGKTAAITQVLSEFRDRETAKFQRDRKYAQKGVLRVRGFRAKTLRDGMIALFKEVNGQPAITGARGRRKTDDELLLELVFDLLNQGIVALVFDEAEYASRSMLEVLRDIMSQAADKDPRAMQVATEGYAAVGIGVVLVGTPVVRMRLAHLPEFKERWTRVIEIDYVPAGEVGEALRFWFPGFDAHITAVGKVQWNGFIKKHVTKGKPVSLRRLDTYARFYFRRVTRKGNAAYTRETVPFLEQQFLLALQEAQCQMGPDDVDSSGGEA